MPYRIAKPGFDPLITHVFVDGDEYLDSDSVFGVRGSCVGQFVRHEPGVAPTGETVEVPFHTLDYRFVLHPRDQAANSCTARRGTNMGTSAATGDDRVPRRPLPCGPRKSAAGPPRKRICPARFQSRGRTGK